MLKMFEDLKGEMPSVDKAESVTAAMLQKWKVVKVSSAKSVLVSERLALSVMNMTYAPQQNSDTFRQPHHDSEPDIFYEISFADAKVERHILPWQPMSACIYNPASSPSTYKQSWSVDSKSGVFANVQFAMLLGLLASVNYDHEIWLGMSGLVSCTVGSRKRLQFQIVKDINSVSGVRRRKVKIESAWSGFLSRVLFEDFQLVPPYDIASRRELMTACVTDERYLQCDAV